MAALDVTAAVGETGGDTMSAATSHATVEDFERVFIRRDASGPVRIRDVTDVELRSESYGSLVYFQEKPSVFIALEVLPTTNPLTVMAQVREGIDGIIVQDNTEVIRSSIPAFSRRW